MGPSQTLKDYFENTTKAHQEFEKRFQYDLQELMKQVEYLTNYMVLLNSPSLKEYLQFAIYLYQEFFDSRITELITLFPPDFVDEDGKVFWTSPKRPPVPIPFDKEDPEHQKFVLTTIKILNSIIPLQENCDDEKVIQALMAAKITRRKIQGKDKNREDLTNEKEQEKPKFTSDDEDRIKKLFGEIKSFFETHHVPVKEIEFEKDDDSNGHIDFITFYSNFRAINYSIKLAKRHEIKLKAGRIIPAIATSTAMVCGSIGIEIYKQMLKVPIT